MGSTLRLEGHVRLERHVQFMQLARSQRRAGRSMKKHVVFASSERSSTLRMSFPQGYNDAISQAQGAVQAALQDGARLVEVEFPPTSLSSVPGDGEGANEMTLSLKYLRQFIRTFQSKAATTRIFFPDQQEMSVATQGKGMDPNAGSWDIDPIFDKTSFKLDYLTKPTGLLDFGLDINKVNVAQRAKDSDELFIIAYPHFNVNEMIAVEELYTGAAQQAGKPIIVFNGELDRIRTGYYPALFYPKIGKLAKDFIPNFTTAYYIHNFKGSKPGVLFRCYPGPWQVLRRHPLRPDELTTVHSSEKMPSLKEVALNILPAS